MFFFLFSWNQYIHFLFPLLFSPFPLSSSLVPKIHRISSNQVLLNFFRHNFLRCPPVEGGEEEEKEEKQFEKHDDNNNCDDNGDDAVTSSLWGRMEVEHEDIRKVAYYLSSEQSTNRGFHWNSSVVVSRFIGLGHPDKRSMTCRITD